MKGKIFSKVTACLMATMMMAGMAVAPASAATTSCAKTMCNLKKSTTYTVGTVYGGGYNHGTVKCAVNFLGNAKTTYYSSTGTHYAVISGKKVSASADVKKGVTASTSYVGTNNGRAYCGGTVTYY